MYVLPASHLKVHALFEEWLAGSKCFCGFVLLLAASIFSSCMDFSMNTQWPARQCFQGADISAKNTKSAKKILRGPEKLGRIFDRFIKKGQKRGQTFGV
jgi:hypothetical protein